MSRSKSLAPKPPTATAPAAPVESLAQQRHELECRIQRHLQTRSGLKFARLTVHQCAQGVCLEGLLENNEEGIDLCDLVKEITDVTTINHVVMRLASPK